MRRARTAHADGTRSTAGAVLANRLTQDKNVSVAVIEGGPSDVGMDV